MAQYRGKQKHYNKKSSKRVVNRQSEKEIGYLLESGTLSDMLEAKRITEDMIKYQWDYYSELARQRDEIIGPIKESLISASKSFQFNRWQRGVKYKYSLHPLSTNGSLTNNGGRFNTGTNVNSQVPTFPALYLASDKDTALQEHLGQIPPSKEIKKMIASSLGMTEEDINELSPRELALCNPSSETVVSVSGKLDKVIDLRSYKSLELFVKLIKVFKISDDLKRRAMILGVSNPEVVKTAKQLLMTFLQSDWTLLPARYAVPSNSQIFGHLVFIAGIEGVIYPSKLTGEPCLALFPKNFVATDSFIMLDDESPHVGVPSKIDGANWRLCEQDIKEIIKKLKHN